MAVSKILVILAILAVVRGSSIMRKHHRSADESANHTRNAHNEDKRLQGQRRQAGLDGRLQADVFQFHVETAPTYYENARRECQDKGDGWDLAVIDTKEKREKVKKGIKKAGDYWVGIRENKSQLKDKWLWLTGKPLPVHGEAGAQGQLSIKKRPWNRYMILSFETGERTTWLHEVVNYYEEIGYICAKN